MPEYYSYYESVGRDPTVKHEISQGRISTYKKDGVFLAPILRWKFAFDFEIDSETEIKREQVNDDGNGWLILKNKEREYTFYVYKFAKEFIDEFKNKNQY